MPCLQGVVSLLDGLRLTLPPVQTAGYAFEEGFMSRLAEVVGLPAATASMADSAAEGGAAAGERDTSTDDAFHEVRSLQVGYGKTNGKSKSWYQTQSPSPWRCTSRSPSAAPFSSCPRLPCCSLLHRQLCTIATLEKASA